MHAYDSITVRGWCRSGVICDRSLLVLERLFISPNVHLDHYWKKVMRRLSNCLYVLVTMSTGAQKTFRRLEGERWGKGTDASEADYLSRAILEFYEDSSTGPSAASEDSSDSTYSLPS
jgi:hypothetical protein